MQIFWRSFLDSLTLFQVPLIAFIFLSAVMFNALFLFAMNRALTLRTEEDSVSLGCLGQIISVLFQGTLVAVFVLLLLPFLFLGSLIPA